MIDLMTYRLRVGLFCQRVRAKGTATDNQSKVSVKTIIFICILLIRCGDIEVNPGPTGKRVSNITLMTMLIFTLIILAGDVELNPGPQGK